MFVNVLCVGRIKSHETKKVAATTAMAVISNSRIPSLNNMDAIIMSIMTEVMM